MQEEVEKEATYTYSLRGAGTEKCRDSSMGGRSSGRNNTSILMRHMLSSDVAVTDYDISVAI